MIDLFESLDSFLIRDFAIASVTAFAIETTFMMLQLTCESFRVGGVRSLTPSVAPFRPFTLAEAASNVFVLFAIMSDPWWWDAFSVTCAVQVAGYLWSETSGEWSVLVLTLIFVPGALKYAVDIYLLLCAILVSHGKTGAQEIRQACTAMFQLGAWMLSKREGGVFSFLMAGIGAELAIFSLHRRITGTPPALKDGPPWIVHMLLIYVAGMRYTDARSWHEHVPSTPSCLPEEVKGCTWRCQTSSSVVARRIHSSALLEDGTVLLPFYWEELAFRPTLRGGLLCLLCGLRLPITVRAKLVSINASLQLKQTDVLVFGWVLPEAVSSAFEDSLVPGERCPTVEVVLTPTRLTLRRVTELILTISLLRYMGV